MEIKIKNMLRNPNDDLVTDVIFELTKTSGQHTAIIPRKIGLSRGETFIAFESLTEQVVKSWIMSSFNANELQTIESMLDSQLDMLANPPVRPVSGIPW
jgi:hypothetical protein